jgi:hypothetical protein
MIQNPGKLQVGKGGLPPLELYQFKLIGTEPSGGKLPFPTCDFLLPE